MAGGTTIAYTDGACLGNPGPGGWAWAVPDGPFASGADAATTNQRMEIAAALEAVRALDGPLEVRSDSTYVVHCFRDRWWEGWIARGWKTAGKQPVKNRDLWEPLIDAVRTRGDVRFTWVKGHSGERWNDVVDRLAVEAAETQRGRRGDEPPTDLGIADAPGAHGPGAAARVDLRRPKGHLVLVAGHRPTALGGYDEGNPVAAGVRRRLAEVLAAKRDLEPDLVVVTGLLLGAEQIAADAARDAGVPYAAVLGFPELDGAWPASSRRRFETLVDAADQVVELERKAPSSPQQVGAALRRRDAWLARNVDEALLVWDGEDAALDKLHRTLVEHLGEEGVWVVPPVT